jgi:rare lipoprotein A
MKKWAYAGFLFAWAGQAQVAQPNSTPDKAVPSTPPNARQLALSRPTAQVGHASWYGEDHRGRLMANGERFDPDKLIAASWFYPLGTRVRVTLKTDPNVLNPQPPRSVVVTITDRGPHNRLVRGGRIIDLSHGVFRRLADPDVGLIEVIVRPETPPASIAMRSAG